jgi:hypothetical protein
MIYFETYRDVDASDAPTRRGGFVLRKRVIKMIMSYEDGSGEKMLDKVRLFDGPFLKFRAKRKCRRMLENYEKVMDAICEIEV